MAIASGIISYYEKSNFSLLANTGTMSAAGYNAITVPLNTIGATLIVIALTWSSGAPFTVGDSRSNTYIQVPSTNLVRMYYCVNPLTSSSHTFNVTSTSSPAYPIICVQVFTGGIKTVVDDTDYNIGPNFPPIPATLSSSFFNKIKMSFENEVIVTAFSGNNLSPASTLSVDSSYIITNQIQDVTFPTKLGMAYLIQSAEILTNPTWTYYNNSSHMYPGAVIISFK